MLKPASIFSIVFLALLLAAWAPHGIVASGGGGSTPIITSRSLVGASPAVTNSLLTWNGAAAQVDANQTLTSCAITAGNGAGNFACAASGAGINISITSTGATNLTSTTAITSFTLTVTGTNGNGTSVGVTVPVSVYPDGSTGAPPGIIQDATLFSGYYPSLATRPPWNVAGVDYPVGINRTTYPTNAALKDPASASLPTGTSRNTSTHVFTVSGNNVTLDGWDFSLEGGWTVNINGTGAIITNNNFEVGANAQNMFLGGTSASGATIEFNSFDGHGIQNGSIGLGLIGWDGPNVVIQWNLMQNAYSEDMVTACDTAAGCTQTIQYNLIKNAGMGFGGGAHGDWIQIGIGTTSDNLNTLNMNFNSWVQDIQIASGRTQGITYSPEGPVTAANYNNNTSVVVVGGYVNAFLGYDLTWQITNSLQNNFTAGIGQSNGGGGNFATDFHGSGPSSGTITCGSTNIQMETGNPVHIITGNPC